MAVLFIAGVVAVVVLLYVADRFRKAQARARRLHELNDRLAAAAARIDEEQARARAAARASAELTSVLPAIKRPPLTLPGVAGRGPGTDAEAGEDPAAGPAAQEASAQDAAAQKARAQRAGAGEAADGPETGLGQVPAADVTAAAGIVAGDEAAQDSAAEDEAAQDEAAPDGTAEDEAAGGTAAAANAASPVPDGPVSMPAAVPRPRLRLTADGTLIMSPVPAGPPEAEPGKDAGTGR